MAVLYTLNMHVKEPRTPRWISAILTLDQIHALALRILAQAGLSGDQAQCLADIITQAEADDCRSHGLYRLPGYVAALNQGRARPQAVPSVAERAPSLLWVDADGGFVPPAARAARPAQIAMTRRQGIAAMAVTNGFHFSALWADIEPLCDAGLIAFCFVVGQSCVAPHGGTQRLMGTNPIAFGWPRPDGAFVFDFATSAAARGEVELRRLASENLPPGWALDATGQPTTDPAQALRGALLPFGGAKGSALSMMVELIAGPLIGEVTSRQVAQLGIADAGPPPGGALFLTLDPQAFGMTDPSAAEAFFAQALAQPGLRLPGQRRHQARARARTQGVPVPADLLARIEALSQNSL